MKQFRILVTAVGAIVGYGIIESLRLSGYSVHIVGSDIFPDAVGQYFADDFVVAEPAASPSYLDFLKTTVDEHQIDLVLFGIEQEISAVSNGRELLGKTMTKLAVNSKHIIDLTDDKWLTRNWLLDNGLSDYAIDSAISGDFQSIRDAYGDRFLIKPRISRASKGIVPVDSEDDFNYFKKKLADNFMVQRIVGDMEHEYTVGVFGLGDGRFSGAVYLRRTLSQEGATAKAWVIEDPALEDAAARITERLMPVGPTNYQFRKEGDSVYLLEINPRISSSVSIRSKFGFNEPKMCIEYYLEGKTPAPPVIKPGRAIRYIKDWMVEE